MLDAFQNLLVVGVEDGSFQKGLTEKTVLAVVLFKGTGIEDVRTPMITVDGLDATKIFVENVEAWNFETVMLAGISYAGFNVIDPFIVHERFSKPVVVITRTKPDNRTVKKALKRHFEDWELRWKVFEKVANFSQVSVMATEPPLYFNVIGASVTWASNVIRALSVCGRVPEPVRVTRLIARGLS